MVKLNEKILNRLIMEFTMDSNNTQFWNWARSTGEYEYEIDIATRVVTNKISIMFAVQMVEKEKNIILMF